MLPRLCEIHIEKVIGKNAFQNVGLYSTDLGRLTTKTKFTGDLLSLVKEMLLFMHENNITEDEFHHGKECYHLTFLTR